MVSSLKELIDDQELTDIDDPDEKFIINGVSWQKYEALLVKLEDNSHYRITYLDGVLEIASPSIRHEKIKTRLATLIEFYLFWQRIRHTPMGSSTIKKQIKQAGAEPDECYCIGEEKKIPDLAIEVIITSGSIKKLETYRRLGVIEIWFWENNRISIYHLREDNPTIFLSTYGYEQITISEFLPELDISLLEECTMISDQLQAIAKFEKGINK